MDATTIVMAIFLGLGLSASTGLNTFLPLLLLAAAARFNIAGIELGEKFQWLSSDAAIIVLIVACVVEIVADKVPSVDHFLDTIGTFVRPLAGAVASASVLTGIGLDPTTGAVLGLIIGAPISFAFHTLKAGTRVASSAATFGCANPFISIFEDVASFFLSVAAIFAPLVVPFLLIFFAWALWLLVKRIRRGAAVTSPAVGSGP